MTTRKKSAPKKRTPKTIEEIHSLFPGLRPHIEQRTFRQKMARLTELVSDPKYEERLRKELSEKEATKALRAIQREYERVIAKHKKTFPTATHGKIKLPARRPASKKDEKGKPSGNKLQSSLLANSALFQISLPDWLLQISFVSSFFFLLVCSG